MVEYHDKFEKKGYCTLTVDTTENFIRLCEDIGEIKSSRKNSEDKYDTLTVSSNRLDRSLSSKYRTEQFPFHTDGAYLFTPPRYVLLRSTTDVFNCPTLICLVKPSASEKTSLQRDTWLINGGRGKFYSSILSLVSGIEILRFDADCMKTTNSSDKSKTIINDIIINSEIVEIHWKKNQVVILDNWKVLHGRANASDNMSRILQRVWVN